MYAEAMLYDHRGSSALVIHQYRGTQECLKEQGRLFEYNVRRSLETIH
jgi:hypothetical protein